MLVGKKRPSEKRRKVRGQAALEYAMLLAILSGLIMIIGTGFKNKMAQLLSENGLFGAKMSQYFDPGKLHKLPISIPKR